MTERKGSSSHNWAACCALEPAAVQKEQHVFKRVLLVQLMAIWSASTVALTVLSLSEGLDNVAITLAASVAVLIIVALVARRTRRNLRACLHTFLLTAYASLLLCQLLTSGTTSPFSFLLWLPVLLAAQVGTLVDACVWLCVVVLQLTVFFALDVHGDGLTWQSGADSRALAFGCKLCAIGLVFLTSVVQRAQQNLMRQHIERANVALLANHSKSAFIATVVCTCHLPTR